MAVRFDIGDPDKPRGHALLYFRTNEGEILATYVVVLPIAINPAKYIPPAFATRLQAEVNVSATALPPIPETMGDLETVRRVAGVRGDDLLDGGVVMPDPERLMMATHEIAGEYANRYRAMIDALPTTSAETPRTEAQGELDEEELRWVLLSEAERVGELAKLTGQLRYSVDGGDDHLRLSTAEQITRLGRHLPEKFRVGEFLAAAQRPGDGGRRLAELYIDRCYKLSNEQYETLADLDREIASLEGG